METGRAANAKRQPFTSLHWRTNRRTRRPTPTEPNDSQSDHPNAFWLLTYIATELVMDLRKKTEEGDANPREEHC